LLRRSDEGELYEKMGEKINKNEREKEVRDH
jgi:hypothetical protein